MVDLTSEMASLWAALGSAPAHRGRVIQIASATSGEGVSTVALRDEIASVGGRIAGVVMNRSTYRPPAFLKRAVS